MKLDGDKVTGHSKVFEGVGRVRSLATTLMVIYTLVLMV